MKALVQVCMLELILQVYERPNILICIIIIFPPTIKGMYCVVKFMEHLCDDPKEELDDVELPEPVDDKTMFWQLEVRVNLASHPGTLTA